ncbi:MBL fold metallo-hydrolase [Bacillus cereus]|nr:MBL fold metallo-hydrolase [Bacillus cereus]
MYSDIEMQMKNLGFPIEKLTGIVLTHQDIDHIGSLSALLEKNPSITVYAHKEDKDYITGKRTLIKVFLLCFTLSLKVFLQRKTVLIA